MAELTEAQVQRIVEQEFKLDADFSVATAAEETQEKTVIETVVEPVIVVETLPSATDTVVAVPTT